MRQKIQQKIIDNADYTIYNPLSINWLDFKWADGYFRHVINHSEIYKFELIPLYYWGISKYSDIILLLNNIPHVWDLFPGAEIKVPKLREVERFILTKKENV